MSILLYCFNVKLFLSLSKIEFQLNDPWWLTLVSISLFCHFKNILFEKKRCNITYYFNNMETIQAKNFEISLIECQEYFCMLAKCVKYSIPLVLNDNVCIQSKLNKHRSSISRIYWNVCDLNCIKFCFSYEDVLNCRDQRMYKIQMNISVWIHKCP